MAEYNRMETKSEGEAGEGAVARTKGSERKREGRTKNVGEGGRAKKPSPLTRAVDPWAHVPSGCVRVGCISVG